MSASTPLVRAEVARTPPGRLTGPRVLATLGLPEPSPTACHLDLASHGLGVRRSPVRGAVMGLAEPHRGHSGPLVPTWGGQKGPPTCAFAGQRPHRDGGRYWVRTSDLLGVNEALYH